ncbi:hypothetical protein BC831DRAFT_397332, partial [Entophlyctis helioformis]
MSLNATALPPVDSLPESLMNGPAELVMIELIITVIGMSIQLCNTIYAIRHAMRLPSHFNIFLVVSMVIYSFSFVPLFLTTGLGSVSSSVNFFNSGEIKRRAEFVYIFNQSHNFMFGLATLMYVLLVQFRFRIIKTMMPYSDALDTIFVTLTILLWTGAAFVVGFLGTIIWPKTVTNGVQLQSFSLWAAYALIVDTTLSFIFMVKLFSSRKKLMNAMRSNVAAGTVYASDIAARRTMSIVFRALTTLCCVSALSFSLVLISATVFAKDPVHRKLMYRIGYSFSPLQFSGALVFVYSVPTLFR